MESKKIVSHFIEITSACNLECRHCYRASRPSGDMALSDVLKTSAATGAETIVVLGGEPLLHPEIKEILTGIKKQGKKITLISNGTELGKYKELIKNTVNRLNISIDFPDERHDIIRGRSGLFNSIKENLISLKKEDHRPTIIIMTPIFNENYESIPQLVKYAEEVADEISFLRYSPACQQVYPEKLSAEKMNSFYREIHELKKKSKLKFTMLDPLYYTLYPDEGIPRAKCSMRVFESNNGECSRCPFYTEISKTMQEVQDKKDEEPLPVECEPCEFKDSCHGGCPSSRLVVNGTLNSRDPYCIKKFGA